jgi:hypothetical protein
MTNELVASGAPMNAVDIRKQVNLIQSIMAEVMVGPSKENPDGVHYGVIPGCKKPSLFKPGAEKLAMVFHLRPTIAPDRDIVVRDMANGHREITVYCHILNVDGSELATGVGSCSTMESKYRYRGGEKNSTGKPVPTEYWNLKKEEKYKEAQELIGGRGFGVMKGDTGWEIAVMGEKQENADIADVYNTVLKIAKKRAFIDGILSSTAASDIFTQDIEELPEGILPGEEAPPARPPIADPKRKSETAAAPAPAAPASTAPAAAPSADAPGDAQEPADEAPAAQGVVPEGCLVLSGRLEKVTIVKEGDNDNGHWKLYGITDAKGVRYSSFSDTVFKTASAVVAARGAARIVFKKDAKGYNNIVSLDAVN